MRYMKNAAGASEDSPAASWAIYDLRLVTS